MADTRYNVVGVLNLGQVTDVIRALFGGMNLESDEELPRQALISISSEATGNHWESVAKRLNRFADYRNYPQHHLQGTIGGAVLRFYCGLHPNNLVGGSLISLIDDVRGNTTAAELDKLLTLANLLDDGHGLRGYAVQGVGYCIDQAAELGSFVSRSDFYGEYVGLQRTSNDPLTLGNQLETALAAGDLDQAADVVVADTRKLLAGIRSDEDRANILSLVLAKL